MVEKTENSVATLYLARGADADCDAKFGRFIKSYQQHDAGIAHTLYVAMKGFSSQSHAAVARKQFASLNPIYIDLEDSRLDVGAYIDSCEHISEEFVCFLNTHSEILAADWLKHFVAHLRRAEVGLVGASGSFESLQFPGVDVQLFPNAHLRTNGFALRRTVLLSLFKNYPINNKLDAYSFENGSNSLTRQITARGYDVLIVGRNGRGYPPVWWPASDTFRQGRQENLLVGDNHTRHFDSAPVEEKRWLMQLAWGSQIELDDTLPAFSGL